MSEAAALHCPACGAPAGPEDTICRYCRAPLATVACPKCFGLAFKGAKNCPYCGVALEAAPERKATEACPGCKSGMETRELGGYSLDMCGRCASVWIDRATFEAFCKDQEQLSVVLEALPKVDLPPINALAQGYRPCPDCQQLMNRVNFAQISGVIVDTCRAHGTFFDPDELRRLVAFLKGGGMDRARSRQIEVLKAAQDHQARTSMDPALGTYLTGMPDPGKTHSSFASFLFDQFLR